jgi:hypothetical protein
LCQLLSFDGVAPRRAARVDHTALAALCARCGATSLDVSAMPPLVAHRLLFHPQAKEQRLFPGMSVHILSTSQLTMWDLQERQSQLCNSSPLEPCPLWTRATLAVPPPDGDFPTPRKRIAAAPLTALILWRPDAQPASIFSLNEVEALRGTYPELERLQLMAYAPLEDATRALQLLGALPGGAPQALHLKPCDDDSEADAEGAAMALATAMQRNHCVYLLDAECVELGADAVVALAAAVASNAASAPHSLLLTATGVDDAGAHALAAMLASPNTQRLRRLCLACNCNVGAEAAAALRAAAASRPAPFELLL